MNELKEQGETLYPKVECINGACFAISYILLHFIYSIVQLKTKQLTEFINLTPIGKPVKMRSSQQEEMKEKFKENQFNLMASDMIWFNRSLADVRHKE